MERRAIGDGVGKRPERASGYRPDIDGMRAIAIVAVVLFHADVPGLGSGFAGVDIFFVISGYLIGGIVYRAAAAGEFRYRAFYARRARRILPALLTVVLVSLLLGLLLMTPRELARLGWTAASATLGLSNLLYWRSTGYFDPAAAHDPMLMTWTLGVEEQFYLLVPILLVALIRFAPRRVLAGLIAVTLVSFALSVVLTAHNPRAAFYLLPSRGWELGTGMILAVAQARGLAVPRGRAAEALAVAGIAAMIASVVLFDEATPFPGLAALLPVLGAAAAIAGGASRASRALIGAAPLAWIGRRSYSWYLWHWPLLAFVRLCSAGAPSAWSLALAVAASFGLAIVSYRFVEQPFRRARRPALAAYGCAAAAVALAGAGLAWARGIPARAPVVERFEAEAAHNPCVAAYGVDRPDLGPECVSSPPERPAVALLGDSHAGALGPGLAGLARERGWGYRILTKGLCRPFTGVTLRRSDMPGFAAECARFNRDVLARLLSDRSVRVVLLAGFWVVPPEDGTMVFAPEGGGPALPQAALFEEGLREMTVALRAAGKRVLLVQDVPSWRADPTRGEIARELPARGALARLASADAGDPLPFPLQADAERILERVARASGAEVLPLRAVLCAPECRYRHDGALLYRDATHLSRAGSAFALAPFAARLFAY